MHEKSKLILHYFVEVHLTFSKANSNHSQCSKFKSLLMFWFSVGQITLGKAVKIYIPPMKLMTLATLLLHSLGNLSLPFDVILQRPHHSTEDKHFNSTIFQVITNRKFLSIATRRNTYKYVHTQVGLWVLYCRPKATTRSQEYKRPGWWAGLM